jgi:cell division protein FtsX
LAVLLGVLGFFIINSKKLADDFKEKIAMTVFFKNEANDSILKLWRIKNCSLRKVYKLCH